MKYWNKMDTLMLSFGILFFTMPLAVVLLRGDVDNYGFGLIFSVPAFVICYLAYISHSHTKKLLTGQKIKHWCLP